MVGSHAAGSRGFKSHRQCIRPYICSLDSRGYIFSFCFISVLLFPVLVQALINEGSNI